MLQSAIEAEVEEFSGVHGDRRDAGGHRLVVRNGYQPARELLTGAGRRQLLQLTGSVPNAIAILKTVEG